MDDKAAIRVHGDPLARWFVTEAYRNTDTARLIAAAGDQLVRAGMGPSARAGQTDSVAVTLQRLEAISY